jgi:SAM-dependent methyltransferase
MLITTRLYFAVVKILINLLTEKEFKGQSKALPNERPVEYGFLLRALVENKITTILDVGSGTTSLPHLLSSCGYAVIAIDNIKDYWSAGMFNRHFHIINDNILAPMIKGPFDAVSCISVLEHITEHQRAMASMYDLLRPGGHCICTFPYNEGRYSANVYEEPGSAVGKGKFPFVAQAFSRKEVETWMNIRPWKIVAQEYWRFFEGEYWTMGARILKPFMVSSSECHQISCIHFVKD